MVRALHIDGSFLAYSRFKAHPSNVSRRFRRRLGELQATYDPGTTIVAWDTKSGTLKRRQLWHGYKANRGEKEEEYWSELIELRADLQADGVTQAQSRHGEADDVIATLVKTTPGPHVIYTADKDLLQLVGPGCSMVKAVVNSKYGGDLEVTHKNMKELRFKLSGQWVQGLSATGWGDLLALAGDASDGIPRIPGIGPSRALQLLEACPTFVAEVVSGGSSGNDYVRETVAAANPRLVKYALRCIEHADDLGVSRVLVTLLENLEDIETW